MCSDVFIIYELSSARVDVHRSKTSLPLNSLKINSPSLLLFARMFTARVTKKIPLMNLFAIRIFVQFFLSECLLSSTGYLSGDTDHSVTDETESNNDQGGFIRHGNTP